jgi:large subunit ribosomal protein L3
MTRLFDEEGNNIPVTVIQAGPCFVSQLKTSETDGYEAVQIAFGDIKGRNSTLPVIGHDAKAGLEPKRVHREVRLGEGEAASYTLGQELTVEVFEGVQFVDVIGTSKGKGFTGVMKRWNFKGQLASHGVERKHRSPGSICGRSSNRGTGKPKKGIRMSGHLGNARITVRSLPIVGVDKEKGLLMVKGPVPGPNKSLVVIREAVRLYKRKAKLAKAS